MGTIPTKCSRNFCNDTYYYIVKVSTVGTILALCVTHLNNYTVMEIIDYSHPVFRIDYPTLTCLKETPI